VAVDCFSITDFDLVVDAVPFATFNSNEVDYEVCPNATVPIEISLVPEGYTEADVTIAWELDNAPFNEGNGLTIPVLLAGTYTAVITFNNTGCEFVVSAEVIELEQCVIPEGISPNNDGLNDRFDLSSFGVVKLEIFNRNGTLVYSKDNYRDEWFGQTNKGENLPVGTYFYTMIYEGGAKKRSAWVYISR
jgi:gliding motility-associated-like protein